MCFRSVRRFSAWRKFGGCIRMGPIRAVGSSDIAKNTANAFHRGKNKPFRRPALINRHHPSEPIVAGFVDIGYERGRHAFSPRFNIAKQATEGDRVNPRERPAPPFTYRLNLEPVGCEQRQVELRR